jgi:glycosyltransferase involved in cell wall biosynthesis
MRIGIDARFLTHPQRGGFKTYTEQLVAALAAVDHENEYILYVDRAPGAQDQIPSRPNMTVRIVGGTMPSIGMPWREQVALPLQAMRDKIDLLHAPSLTAPVRPPCRLVVTIHDTIWLTPERYTQGTTQSGKRGMMQRYYQMVPRIAAEKATAVITVSHDARRSIVEELKVPADQVFVTHEAANPVYRRVTDAAQLASVRASHQLSEHFILALGSADPRKNIATLLCAYAGLPEGLRATHELAIVWTHTHLAGHIAALADELGIRDRIRFLTGVTNQDLVALYNMARLFVFPSRYEGFGLPLLEAMACGTPVVAANNSSIPEIVGDAALMAGADDLGGITSQITRALSDADLRDRLVRAGIERAASFSWERCARETIAAYRAALAHPRQRALRQEALQ